MAVEPVFVSTRKLWPRNIKLLLRSATRGGRCLIFVIRDECKNDGTRSHDQQQTRPARPCLSQTRAALAGIQVERISDLSRTRGERKEHHGRDDARRRRR